MAVADRPPLRAARRGDRGAMAGCDRSSRARVTAWWGRSAGRRMRWPPPSPLSRRSRPSRGPQGAELRVRIAVHTGEAQLRDRRQLRRSRAQPVRRGSAPAGTAVRCWCRRRPRRWSPIGSRRARRCSISGLHRLQDLGRPEHIWQVVHPDLPSTFPPLRSLDVFRHNLPVQLTPLIGRDRRDRRRPRPARRRAAGDADGFGRGRQDPPRPRRRRGRASSRIPAACGGSSWRRCPIRTPSVAPRWPPSAPARRPARPRADQLAVELGDQPSLLVLDNCEHLIAGCAGARRRAPGGQPVRVGAGDQPRTARRARGDHVAGPVAALPRSRADRRRPDAVAVRRRGPVRRTCPPGATIVRRRARPTPPPSPRSATASTASRSPSSWPPPAAGSCPPNASPPSSTTASGS